MIGVGSGDRRFYLAQLIYIVEDSVAAQLAGPPDITSFKSAQLSF